MTIWLPIRVYDHIKNKGYPVPDEAMITQNFFWNEVLKNQTDKPNLEILKNLSKIIQILQKYRDTIFEDSPITITSGWRSNFYNQKIGGAKNSYHLYGMALDFIVKGFNPRQVQKLLDPIHKGGLEFAPTWTHIDIRPENIRFNDKGRIVRYG